MSSPSSRRNFLRGRVAAHRAEPHPPWALAEPEFIAACTRCGDCARACPTRIIRQGDGGYPMVDFALGECTFCGQCVAHCPSGALLRQSKQPPWQLRAEIGERCIARQQVECRICGEMCEFAAIRFVPQPGGIAAPLLDGERCTGCGACVAPCPTTAITVR